MLYFKFYDKSSKGNSLLRKKIRTLWVKFLSKIHKMFRLCAEFDEKILLLLNALLSMMKRIKVCGEKWVWISMRRLSLKCQMKGTMAIG